MPVDFLSAGHRAAYGWYSEPPSDAQLERFFHFDERDRALIDRRRGDHNRLGFAVQLSTVRFLGTFLARRAEVPQVVAARVAEELGVAPGCLTDYTKREPTLREHAGEIQCEYGYRDFSEPSARTELVGWLDARAWATAERPSVLFDLATARLIDAKVLLPGASVLARAVASARDRAAARLHRTLAEAAGEKRRRLDLLLEVPEEQQLSRLEALRAGPRRLTASEAAEAFERLAAIVSVGTGDLAADVPAGRLRALARYGLAANAQKLRRLRAPTAEPRAPRCLVAARTRRHRRRADSARPSDRSAALPRRPREQGRPLRPTPRSRPGGTSPACRGARAARPTGRRHRPTLERDRPTRQPVRA